MGSKLFSAAQLGNIPMYKDGLADGLNINTTNSMGQTSLMLACNGGHSALVQFIISEGADITFVDYTGRTAADYAYKSGNKDVIAFFNTTFNTDEADEDEDTSLFAELTNNIYTIITDIRPLLNSVEYTHRPYLVEDFAKILLLATKGSDFKMLYKYSFGLMSFFILQQDQDFDVQIENLNTMSEHKLVNMFIETYNRQQAFFDKMQSQEYFFSLNSFPLFIDGSLDILKKALYEFAEVIIKADGNVTDAEVKNLKAINADYLTIAASYSDAMASVSAKTPLPVGAKAEVAPLPNAQQNGAIVVSLEKTLEELNSLVGLDNIKQDVNTLINIISANKLREKEGLPEMKVSLHSVFMGPPGTGKTTVARMLADIYSALGVLTQNNFIETDRAGLVAGYVGQTAIKTDGVIAKAQNGVLFIDEAYTLKRDDSQEDFGQEAIDIMLKRMEDFRNSLVIVVAGYEDEMNYFIDSNPGLKSRFNRYFYFKDYNAEELTEIYSRIATKAGFVLTDKALQRLKELFIYAYNTKNKQFGNARLVRNIFEKTFEKHANRTASIAPITREILTTIEEADIPFTEYTK